MALSSCVPSPECLTAALWKGRAEVHTSYIDPLILDGLLSEVHSTSSETARCVLSGLLFVLFKQSHCIAKDHLELSVLLPPTPAPSAGIRGLCHHSLSIPS